MANAQTQAIILKDFSGGIWLNEGEPPSNKYAAFMENLDPLFGGGVQKRAPVRRNYLVKAGGAQDDLIYSSFGYGPMVPWMQADPTNGVQYVIAAGALAATTNQRLMCWDRTTSTVVWSANIGTLNIVTSFDYASSDAGSNWYVHGGNSGPYRVTTGGTPTVLTQTFNENLAAPTNGNMPRSTIGTQHLAAYYFLGAVTDGGTLFKNRLRWSHPGRFEDYRAADKQDIGDGSAIIGLYSVGESLLIVKETEMWVMTGFDPATFEFHKVADFHDNAPDFTTTVSRVVGCSQTQKGAFVCIQGSAIYKWDGHKLEDISGGLADALRDGRVSVRRMAVLGGTLYMSSGTAYASGTADSTTDLSWEYNLETGAWTQHNAPFVALAPIQATVSGNPRGYALHQHGKISTTWQGFSFSFYRQRVAAGSWCDSWTGSDVDIVCQYRSPWQDARNPARKKRWRRPWIVFNKRPNASASDPVTYGTTVFRNWDGVHAAKTGTVTAVKATDTTDYNSTFGYGHTATGSDFDEGQKLQSLGSAFSVQLLLSSSGTPKDQWGFDSLTFKYVPMVLR